MSENQQPNKILEEVIKTIKDKGVKIRPNWHFRVKNIILWTMAVLTTLIGSIAVSSIIFKFSNFQRIAPPGPRLHREAMTNTLDTFPFVWIIIFIIFIYFLYKEIRITRKGYKYEMPILILSMTTVSLLLGIALYTAGSGYFLDKKMGRFNPDVERMQHMSWQRPGEGLLVGEVQSVKDNKIIIKDPEGKDWQVTFSEGEDTYEEQVSIGEKIGLIGIGNIEESTFEACGIKKLELAGMGMWQKRKQQTPDERNSFNLRINICGERTTPPID